jgi:hypothetical protein
MASWDQIPIDSESAFELARKENLDVRVADDYTLQLDCDDETSVNQFHCYEPRLRAHFGIKEITETKSRHQNTHIYVTLENPMTVPERIALQAALGSDPTREFLSLKRWLSKDPNPILLFEVKPVPKEL